MKQKKVMTEVLQQLPPDFFDIDPNNLSKAESALRQGYSELSGHVAKLSAELEAARLARRKENRQRENLLNRFATMLDALPGGVIILDCDGVITEANPQARALLGEPLEGESWEVIERRGRFNPHGSFEIKGRRLNISTCPLPGDAETIVLVSDITAQHALQRELGRKTRLSSLGEMAARLAHQIRTPLSSTTLYVDQLSTDIDQDKRTRICTALKAQLSQMEHLVTSMLGFVRGGSLLCLEPADVKVIVDEALSSCEGIIEASKVSVLTNRINPSLKILAAPAELSSVIANMIQNSIQVCDSNAEIEVWAGAINQHTMLIRVSDNGPGIPNDIIDQVFDPFFTTRAAGTGLGLAVLASVVQRHGGTVHATNRESGGAQFTIVLPVESTLKGGDQ
jgi:two-component system sensor histidine kinase FlrB